MPGSSRTRVRVLDVVWVVVAVAGAVGFGTAIAGLVDVIIDPEAQGLVWRVLEIAVTVLLVLGASWIALGAWGRTTWGCRLELDADDSCPRHGPHCRAAEQPQTVG